MRRAASLLALIAMLVAVSSADARIPIRVGIGDQQAATFDQPAFEAAKFKRVRYFIHYNALDNEFQRLRAREYVKAARANGISVLLHLSSDDQGIKTARLPSVAEYRRQVRRIVAYFRPLGVREFGTWNEVNHASQPTYRSPTRAADYFREAYRAVKGSCKSCAVVALDVLDQTGVERYMRSFYRHLSPTYRKRATIVGIHNYSDVNRRRAKPFTGSIIRQSRAYLRSTRIWITETGGLVKVGSRFPCNPTRAANRLKTVFSPAHSYRRSGVERLYPYSWTGAGCDARFDAGLTNPDGSVRPGYKYLRTKLGSYLR